MRRETREYRGSQSACSWLSWGAVLTGVPLPVLRLLHLFAARGLRWAAYAAAEMLQMYRHLDIREHKGKVRARGLDSWIEGRRSGAWISDGGPRLTFLCLADPSPGGCRRQPAPDCGGSTEPGSRAQCH